MTYEEIVAYAKKKVAAANLKSYKGHMAAQVNITGEGEGAFYIELNDGTAAVEPYEYYDRDVVLISSADTFIAILDGKKSAQDAVANGELSFDGNAEKALELAEVLKKAPAKKAAAKKAPAKKAEAKPAAKKAPAKKAEAKPVAEKAPAKTATKTTAKAPAKKAEAKPAAAKTVAKATTETKKAAVATAKKNVSKKVTK